MLHSFSQAYSQSDMFGKLIFWGLYSLSLLTWLLIFYKGYIFWKVRQKSQNLPQIFKQSTGQSIFHLNEELLEVSDFILSPFRVIYSHFKDISTQILSKNQSLIVDPHEKKGQAYFKDGDIQVIADKLQGGLNTCLVMLEKRLYLLNMVVSLAPFLGLLGTVWGILITLSHLQSSSSIQGNELVLGGLSLALTTTVLGLLIAIPALIGANFFKSQLRSIHCDLSNFSQNLLEKAEIQFKNINLCVFFSPLKTLKISMSTSLL